MGKNEYLHHFISQCYMQSWFGENYVYLNLWFRSKPQICYGQFYPLLHPGYESSSPGWYRCMIDAFFSWWIVQSFVCALWIVIMQCHSIWKGANFQGCFLSYVFMNLALTLDKLFYPCIIIWFLGNKESSLENYMSKEYHIFAFFFRHSLQECECIELLAYNIVKV